MTEPSTAPDAPAGPDAQASDQAQLDAILNDRSHVYHTGGHGYEAAQAEVLDLRRRLLGANNRVAVEYREGEPDRPAATRSESAPISMLYGREEFLSGIPGDVPTPERHRAAAAAESLGLSWFEAQQIANATEGPVPDPGDELDLTELWGDDADANARVVNRLLTRLRAVDEDLHDRIVPYVQRRAAVAARVLSIARRLGT